MSENNYTDIVMQLLSAFYIEDADATKLTLKSLFDDLEKYDDSDIVEALIPGLLFGSMIHMKIMLCMIEELMELEDGKAIQVYAEMYNHYREQMLEGTGFPIRIEDGGEMIRRARKDPGFFDS